MYTYDLGIHSGANTCVPSVSSKGIVEEDKACGRQYTLKKTTTCTQAVPQSQGLCLAFVESDFNITKANENTDGSFDYGIFQINSHDWCRNYQSHTENPCHVDCQALARAPGWERTAEPQPSLNHQLCKKACVWSRGHEELGKMQAALCRPATLLLEDRMPRGMRQGTGLWWSHSRIPLLTSEFFISSSSCLHFLLSSSLPFTNKTDQSPRNHWCSRTSSLFPSRPRPLVP
ncbi:lysozyme-like protein 6 isoform X1 [Camelus dromedarius]|uniref:lysozyme-like protein 6 isoform X1 n=1 Tax=Camelus dromedarius TaxID=9838 RepID=UPI00311A8821